MKILVESQVVLSAPLRVMSIAVSTRPVVPELSCIKLTAEDDVVSYFATTGFLSLYNPVSSTDINVVEPGSVLVNYSLFVAALSSIEGPISLHTTSKNLMVTSTENKRISRRIPLAILDNLPEPASVNGEAKTISAPKLQKAIKYTSFAALRDESRPVLRSTCIGNMSVWCGDGARASCYTLDTDLDVMLTAEATAALSKLLPDDDDVRITVDNWILVEFPDGKELRVAGTEGTYPDINAILVKVAAKTAEAIVTITTSSIFRVFGGISAYTEKAIKFGIVYVEIHGEGGRVYVKTEVPSVGMFEDELDCEYIGNDFVIMINPQHIMDLVNTAKSEKIEIKVYGATDPLLVSDPATDEWKVVQCVIIAKGYGKR